MCVWVWVGLVCLMWLVYSMLYKKYFSFLIKKMLSLCVTCSFFVNFSLVCL